MLNDKTARSIASTLADTSTPKLSQFLNDGVVDDIDALVKELDVAFEKAKSTRIISPGFKSKQQQIVQKLISYVQSGTRMRWRHDRHTKTYHTSWSQQFDKLPYIK